jgi:hypothetical protein
MTRTITVRGREYTVEDEPRLNGEIAPHLYSATGELAGVVIEAANGLTWIIDTPWPWTASDIRDAVRQILA